MQKNYAKLVFDILVFEGSPNEISGLYNRLKSLCERKEPLLPTDFGKEWLGCVVALFGGDPQQIACRGTFECLQSISPESLSLNTYTAWADMPAVWEWVRKTYPSLRWYFRAEECGFTYYVTNDRKGKYFPERFLVDELQAAPEYYVDEEEALEVVADRTGLQAASLGELEPMLKEWNARFDDNFISVKEFSLA